MGIHLDHTHISHTMSAALKPLGFLTHCGQGHINCLNARSQGLNNIDQLLYRVSLTIYNKFVNYFCVIKCIVHGNQAWFKNADLCYPSCTVVMYKRKSASPVHNVLRLPVMLLMFNSQLFKHSIQLRTPGISNMYQKWSLNFHKVLQIPKSLINMSSYNVYLNNFTFSSKTESK
jgi:hypothetical protein